MVDQQAQMLRGVSQVRSQGGGQHIQQVSSSFERMSRAVSKAMQKARNTQVKRETQATDKATTNFLKKLRSAADATYKSLGNLGESMSSMFNQERQMNEFAWRGSLTFNSIRNDVEDVNESLDESFGRRRIIGLRRWERETERSLKDVKKASEEAVEPLNNLYSNITSSNFQSAIQSLASIGTMGAIGDIRGGVEGNANSIIQLGDSIRKQMKLTKKEWNYMYDGMMEDLRGLNKNIGKAMFSDTDYFNAASELLSIGVKSKEALTKLTPQLLEFKSTLVDFTAEDYVVFVRIEADWGDEGVDLNQRFGDSLVALEGKYRVTGKELSATLEKYYPKMYNWADGDIHAYEDMAKQFIAIQAAMEDSYMDSESMFENLVNIRGLSPASDEYVEWASTFAKVGLNIEDIQGQLKNGDFQGAATNMITNIGKALKEGNLDEAQRDWLKENLSLDGAQLEEITKGYSTFSDKLAEVNKEVQNSAGAMEKVLQNERISMIDRAKNWITTTGMYQNLQKIIGDVSLTPEGLIATMITLKTMYPLIKRIGNAAKNAGKSLWGITGGKLFKGGKVIPPKGGGTASKGGQAGKGGMALPVGTAGTQATIPSKLDTIILLLREMKGALHGRGTTGTTGTTGTKGGKGNTKKGTGKVIGTGNVSGTPAAKGRTTNKTGGPTPAIGTTSLATTKGKAKGSRSTLAKNSGPIIDAEFTDVTPNNPSRRIGSAGTKGTKGTKGIKRGTGKLGKIGKMGGVAGVVLGGLALAPSVAKAAKKGEVTQDLASGVGNVGGGIAGAAAGAAIGSIVPVIGTAVGGIVGGIVGSMGGEEIANWLYNKKDTIVGTMDEAFSAVSNAASKAWDSTKAFASSSWDSVSTVWSNGKESLKGWFGEVGTKSSEVWDSTKTFASNTWTSISSTWTTGKENLKGWFGEVGSKASEAWNTTKTTATNTWSSISGTWSSGKENLKGWFGEVKGKGSELWTDVKTNGVAAANSASTAFSNFGTSAKSNLSGLKDTMSSIASNAAAAVKSLASTAWDKVKGATGKVVSTVTGKDKGKGKGGGLDAYGSGKVSTAGNRTSPGHGFKAPKSSMGPTFTKTSGYGNRKDPFTGATVKHRGVDYAAPTGTPIGSQGSGTVIYSGMGTSGSGYGGYGNVVAVKGDDGKTYLYAHMSKVLADKGSRVNAGTRLGLVGSTGRSTGPHLHYEVRTGGYGTDINPMPYVNNSIFNPGAGAGSTGIGMGLLDATKQILSANEGSYTTVVKSDNGHGVSIGKMQWHENRAKELMQMAKNADPTKFNSIMKSSAGGKSVINKMGWSSWDEVKFTDAEASATKALFSDSTFQKVQDNLMDKDISNYLVKGQEKGLADKALVYFADLYNQSPARALNIATTAVKNGGTLEAIHQAALSEAVMGKYSTRRNTTYGKLKNMGSLAGVVGSTGTSSTTQNWTQTDNANHYKNLLSGVNLLDVNRTSGTGSQLSVFGNKTVSTPSVGGGEDSRGSGASAVSSIDSQVKSNISGIQAMSSITRDIEKAKKTSSSSDNGDVVSAIKWLAARLEGKLDEVSQQTDENTAWINKYRKANKSGNPFADFS